MRKYKDPFTANAPLTEEQKKAVNYFTMRIPKPKKGNGRHTRIKYFCPTMNDWYLATPVHTICKMCNENHDIIKFDRRKHNV